MDKLKIGQIIQDEQYRDAIHMAVAPVTAACRLSPGQHIGLVGNHIAGVVGEPIGIVDPFLKTPVSPGERFWMFLYPGTITSLRHEWEHPHFACNLLSSDAQSALFYYNRLHPKHELWLREFADKINLSYEGLIAAAKNYLESGSYLSEGGKYEGLYTDDEFWDHYEQVTGVDVPEAQRGSFFSCGC